MSFQFTCPFCNQAMECEDAWAGQTAQCPSCGHEVVLQPPGTAMPPPPPPPVSSPTMSSGGAFEVACPQCGQGLQLQREWAGQTVQCPQCGQGFVVPGAVTVPDFEPETQKRFNNVLGETEISTDELDQLKYGLDTRVIRLFISYPFWVTMYQLAVMTGGKFSGGPLVGFLIGVGILFPVASYAKKNWGEGSIVDHSLAAVGLPIGILFAWNAINYDSEIKTVLIWIFILGGGVMLVGRKFLSFVAEEGDGLLGDHIWNRLGGLGLIFGIPCLKYAMLECQARDDSLFAWLLLLYLVLFGIWWLCNFIQLIVSICRWVYHVWNILPEKHRATSPSLAAALLWVPVVNLFWPFVTFWKLACGYRDFFHGEGEEAGEGAATSHALGACIAYLCFCLIYPSCCLGMVWASREHDETVLLMVGLMQFFCFLLYFCGLATLGKAMTGIQRQATRMLIFRSKLAETHQLIDP